MQTAFARTQHKWSPVQFPPEVPELGDTVHALPMSCSELHHSLTISASAPNSPKSPQEPVQRPQSLLCAQSVTALVFALA